MKIKRPRVVTEMNLKTRVKPEKIIYKRKVSKQEFQKMLNRADNWS